MKTNPAAYGIHWFRRDLRIAGNLGLQFNWKKNEGRVLGIFCFDKKFLARPDFSANRFQFFLETLVALKKELQDVGGDLLCLDVGPQDAFAELFARLRLAGLPFPSLFTWNRDYEPFARDRDLKIEKLLKKEGIAIHSERDHLLIEPQEIYKDGKPQNAYRIFTPFSRQWFDRFREQSVQSRIEVHHAGLGYLQKIRDQKPPKLFSITWKDLIDRNQRPQDVLDEYAKKNGALVKMKVPAAGSLAALEVVKDFGARLKQYDTARDIPAVNGTSHFSIYLKNGSLNIGQIISELKLNTVSSLKGPGAASFLRQLIWREFYYYILARFPYVEQGPFQIKYAKLPWENNERYFRAWKEGKTGFPIVDAGMRQLNETGWMHNRVRMIVASFLTKDLLVDWQLGERYFMEKLYDGDLAPNNGGWQWAASTGCDPQPYFRIFNPLLQSQKFDPDGTYIKEYIPELRHLNAKQIHAPSAGERRTYPSPIVEHAKQREIALEIYQRVRGSENEG